MSDPEWPERGRCAILVTGASSGIGAALARVAARDNQPMLLVARNAAALAALAGELAAAGAEAYVLALDLLDPGAAAAIGATLTAHGLVCDVLVNNAGRGSVGAAAELPAADQLGCLDLNLRAAMALTLAALPGMKQRRRGGVLNVGSIAGFIPGPGMAAYYASKAGLRSFSEALWAEMRGDGVVVSYFGPGPVRTRFLAESGANRTKLFRMMPKVTAVQAADTAWSGFRRRKRLIFPNLATRSIARAARLLPRAVLLRAIARLQRAR